MTTAGSGILLDTNVLLAATTPARGLHGCARRVLDDWPNRGRRLCVSGQVLREYLVVATREPEHHGLGLGLADALGNAEAIEERCRLLAEGPEVAAELRKLLRAVPTTGKAIHDANLVATALAHGVPGVVTENLEDFERFRERLEIVPLSSA